MTTKLKAGEMAARARLTLVVAALVVSLPASPAHADDAAATTRAQADVNAAAAHYDAGRFHEAYVLFKSASADYPSPHVRANMVLAGSKSGHPTDRVESARVARALLRDGKMKPQDVVHVTSALEALGPTLGRIEVRGQGTTPVRVDGVLVEHTQLVDPYDVVPGSHEVLFAAERHVVNVPAGATAVVEPGETSVVAQPSKPAAPVTPATVIAPTHETKRVFRDGRWIATGVLGGLAVASLGTGLATFLVGSSAQSDAEDRSLSSNERNDAVDRATTMRTISTITTYAGIGLGVAAVVPLFVWPKKTVPLGALHFTPLVAPNHIGLRATF